MAGTKSINIKVTDADGKEHDVKIDVNEDNCSAKIAVDGKTTDLTKLKKSDDGKQISGKTTVFWYGEITVTVTINCDTTPPTIKIVAKDKKGKEIKSETFTFTHEEQERLITFIKQLDLSKCGQYLCNLNKSDPKRKPEFHDLTNKQPGCQIDEIKQYDFAESKEDAKNKGFDACANCIPGESTK